jgi:hypothetical protein
VIAQAGSSSVMRQGINQMDIRFDTRPAGRVDKADRGMKLLLCALMEDLQTKWLKCGSSEQIRSEHSSKTR